MNEESLPPDDRVVVLSVGFDVMQRSKHLVWRADQAGHTVYELAGPQAGSVVLSLDGILTVKVTGLYDRMPFDSYTVVSAGLITVPRTVARSSACDGAPDFYPASPFDATRAVNLVGPFQAPGRGISSSLNQPPLRVRYRGAWEMSMVLTIQYRNTANVLVNRVFTFDPETEVGNGSRPAED